MKDKKEKAKRVASGETTRLSSEEINKKTRNKKAKDMSKTQVIGKEVIDATNKKSKKTKREKDNKKKKQKFSQRHPRIATIIKIILLLLLLLIIICAGIFNTNTLPKTRCAVS